MNSNEYQRYVEALTKGIKWQRDTDAQEGFVVRDKDGEHRGRDAVERWFGKLHPGE